MTRELTGRHVLVIAVVAFGVIIAANLTMLFSALGSFPGLVVQNSYVASQGWNARTETQVALGWRTEIVYANGAVTVAVLDGSGQRVVVPDLVATVGRPSDDRTDRVLTAQPGAPEPDVAEPDVASHRFPIVLAPGVWRILLKAPSQPSFQRTATLYIPETPERGGDT